VPPDTRDQIVDFIRHWSQQTELSAATLLRWLGLGRQKYAQWRTRYGQANEHNGLIPRDFWLEEWEKQAMIAFYQAHPLEGYRRITFMMLDADVVAVSPASVYRVLKAAGLLRPWARKPSKKGSGFVQPEAAPQHWHIDLAYLTVAGTFCFLCSILDGFSRLIVHGEVRLAMTEPDVEIVLQRARECFPEARPRIISDNGPPFIARDFKEFIRLAGMTHVRTSPYYPQRNGKLERWHQSLKEEAIRPKVPLSLDDAQRIVSEYVSHSNHVRLNSAIGYLTPHDQLQGRAEQIFAERDRKREAARAARQRNRAARAGGPTPPAAPTSTPPQATSP
jgi:transposase InsO family protein